MLHKMAIYRPKAREMAGFNTNWEMANIDEAAEEITVIVQNRMQGERSGEKAEEGGNSGEEEKLQPHKWDEEGKRIVEVVEEETNSIVAEDFAEVEKRIGATGVEEEEQGEEDERQPRPKSKPAVEGRWILETNSDRQDGMPDEEEQQEVKEGFRRAFARNIRAEVTRRKGARTRNPTKFFDEVQTGGKTTDEAAGGGGTTEKIGESKR